MYAQCRSLNMYEQLFDMYIFPVEVSRYKNLHRRCFKDIISKPARSKELLLNQKKNTIEISVAKKHKTRQL